MSTAMVPRVRDGSSTDELEQLFRDHYQLVYRTAYSVTGTHQDAEDVLQTIFLRLLRRQTQPDLNERSKQYLYRSAINESLSIIRARQRRQQTDDTEFLEVPSPDAPDDAMEQHLIHAVAQLNPQSVEMLILRYEHNYSDVEIAKMLGKSRGTVAVTLYRARARLRKLLRSMTGERL